MNVRARKLASSELTIAVVGLHDPWLTILSKCALPVTTIPCSRRQLVQSWSKP